jgi:hypothetical protein
MILALMLATSPQPAARHDSTAGEPISQVVLSQASHEIEKTATSLEGKFESMQAKADAALAKAEMRDDQIRAQMSLMLTFIAWILGALTVIISVLTIWGAREVRRVGRARETAEKITGTIDARVMTLIKEAIAEAMKTASTDLPPLADEARLVGAPLVGAVPNIGLTTASNMRRQIT